MKIDDPYRELGLKEEASDTEVKAAWRRLSARWHPDRNANPQALQKIQRINRALDEIWSARRRGQGEILEPAAPPHDAGADDSFIEHSISLSLEEAAAGAIRTLHGEIAQPCALCNGRGEAPAPVTCVPCRGRGAAPQSVWFPWLTAPVRCDACDGRGSRVVLCSYCKGSGQAAPLRYQCRLRIPPGVRDGHQLHARVKLRGREEHRSLNVRIHLQPHEFMSLQENGDVRMEVPVDGFAWMAERWIDVPTPYGMRQMRLQRGALIYRVKGAGLPAGPSGAPADCFVTVVPLFPAQWSDQQMALVDALIQTNTADEATDAGAKAQSWERKVMSWRKRRADADKT